MFGSWHSGEARSFSPLVRHRHGMERIMTSRTLDVPDISCDHCKVSIEGAVAINYDGSDGTFESVVAAIEEQGYEVAK